MSMRKLKDTSQRSIYVKCIFILENSIYYILLYILTYSFIVLWKTRLMLGILTAFVKSRMQTIPNRSILIPR